MRSQPRTSNFYGTNINRNASTYTQRVSYTNTYCCNGSGTSTDNSECCQTNASAIQDISSHLVVIDSSINYLMNVGDLSGVTALLNDISQNVYDNSRSIIEVNQEVDDLSGTVRDLSASVHDLSGQIYNLPSVVNDLSAVVLDLSGDHNTLNTAFLDLSGKVVTNTSNISNLNNTKVSKSGDTMTGNLEISGSNQILFDPAGSNYRGSIYVNGNGFNFLTNDGNGNNVSSSLLLGNNFINTYKALFSGSDIIFNGSNGLIYNNSTAPSNTTNKIYRSGSDIYWNGNKLGLDSSITNVSNVVNDLSDVVLDLSGDHNTLNTAFLDLSGDHNTLNTAFLDLSGDFNTNINSVNNSINNLNIGLITSNLDNGEFIYDISFTRGNFVNSTLGGFVPGAIYINDAPIGTGNPAATDDMTQIFYPPFYTYGANISDTNLITQMSGITYDGNATALTLDLTKPIKLNAPGDTFYAQATSTGQTGNTFNATFNNDTVINLRTERKNVKSLIRNSFDNTSLYAKSQEKVIIQDPSQNAYYNGDFIIKQRNISAGDSTNGGLRLYNPSTNVSWGIFTNSGSNLNFSYNGVNKSYINNDGSDNQLNGSFTIQHRNHILDLSNVKAGMILCSTGNIENYLVDNINEPTINESLPVLRLSNKLKEKSIFGVYSNSKDLDKFSSGVWVTEFKNMVKNNKQFSWVNSGGEGAILVNKETGTIENGDFIMTSSTQGIGCKSDSDSFTNYTIAKATQHISQAKDQGYGVYLISCLYML
jgi:hypothetical protein